MSDDPNSHDPDTLQQIKDNVHGLASKFVYADFQIGVADSSGVTYHHRQISTLILQNLCFSEITGERLWVEFKKILIGRHSKTILPVMIDAGVTQHLGKTSDDTAAVDA